jgi:hypothetical protein
MQEDSEALEHIAEEERCRVATVQAKQALRTAEIQKRLSQANEPALQDK